MNRKRFLRLSARGLAGAAFSASMGPLILRHAWAAGGTTPEAAPSPSPHPSHAPQHATDFFLVIFLRGGADGLSFVPPISGEDRALYESARPTLKIPREGDHGLLKLDERFGLHPSAKPFHELFLSKKLAFVHASGLASDTRSHFDAQAYIELGTPKSKSTQSGWLARHLKARGGMFEPFRAVTVGSLLPTSLLAFEQAAVLDSLGGFGIAGLGKNRDDEFKALQKIYALPEGGGEEVEEGDWLLESGAQTLAAMQRLEAGLKKQDHGPDVTGNYPKGEMGNRLRVLAQLLRMGLGTEVATIDMGGWDTHKYQGKGSEGHFSNQLTQLTQAVSAFYGEMRSLGKPVTILIQSEFGRRLKENASQGTDHGHGNVMCVLGDQVQGGKVYGPWPGLKNEALYGHADLAITTDFRQVVSEILVKRLGERKLHAIFPSYTGYQELGVIRG
jgi:uncharacterized protein (DUF1501 family)